ncbi:hypothetical protein AXY43_23000 [Clostridium sp. MF28]|uniref:helix-turn-helix domain-containing protein n=1 Tax=Clostridium TaxID=1485 RepID=UPI000CF94635|nr:MULTISPECIES: helix-turn-helix transcriptional regulator [Clostridium]AVK50651.1 hypothetical protein AXY43_23000 [Clostridium sp. MF28]PSM59020.1 hypothetical protein C4L39_03945 [Clostridium diolis]
MIGLEYVLKLFEMTQQDLADKLEIKRQNIDSWIRGKRNIPKKHLSKLVEIFNIPEKYFQKELDYQDKEKIQLIKIYGTDEAALGYNNDPDDDYFSKVEEMSKKKIYQYNTKRQMLIDSIKKNLDIGLGTNEYNSGVYLTQVLIKEYYIYLIQKFIDIINEQQTINDGILLKVLLAYEIFKGKDSTELIRGYNSAEVKFIYEIRDSLLKEEKRENKEIEDREIEAKEERENIDKIGLEEYKRQLFEEYDYELLEQYEEYLLKKNEG